MTFIRNCSGHLPVFIIDQILPLEWKSLVYLKLKPSLPELEVILWLPPRIVLRSASHQGCHKLCMDLVGIAPRAALGGCSSGAAFPVQHFSSVFNKVMFATLL